MTTFTLLLTESTLHEVLDAMKHHRTEACQEITLQISVDVVPDGISCEVRGTLMEIIVKPAQETTVPQLFYDAFGGGRNE